MTEHEKMLAGKIYDPFSENMAEERIRAHRLCREYNDTLDTDEAARGAILDELLPARRGQGVHPAGKARRGRLAPVDRRGTVTSSPP